MCVGLVVISAILRRHDFVFFLFFFSLDESSVQFSCSVVSDSL